MRSEVDIATAEVERAQQRLASLERERNALLAQVLSVAASMTLTATHVPHPGCLGQIC